MSRSAVAEKLRAFTPEELLAAHRDGRRDFSRTNLLRAELELVVRNPAHLQCVDLSTAEQHNPLWADFRSYGERDFEWDTYGRCLSVDQDDAPSVRELPGVVLPGINLSGAYLYPIDLSRADLSRADLRHAVFIDCVLSQTKFSRADLRDAQLFDCSLEGADFYMARMDRVVVVRSDARGANLRRAKLRRAQLAGVDLRSSSLENAHCERMALAADLRGVDLSGIQLPGARPGGSIITARQVRPFLRALGVGVKESTGGPTRR